MKHNLSHVHQRKYNNRTIEEWFQAIRDREVQSPEAIIAFRVNKLGSEAKYAVPFLMNCLDDDKVYGEFDVRYVAMYALGRLKTHAMPALEKLQCIARNGELSCNYAYEACLHINPIACGIAFWIDALSHENDVVVRTAAEGLSKFGKQGAAAVDPLITAALAHVKFGVPQNYSFCLSALLKIAQNSPKVLSLAEHVLNKIDVFVGIQAIAEIDTPESKKIMSTVFGVCRPEMKGLYGNKIRRLIRKYANEHPEFNYMCNNCGQIVSEHNDWLCDTCKS